MEKKTREIEMTNPTKFNLSEKIEGEDVFKWISVADIKEFIRLLKEKIRLRSNVEIIDKLCGEKLK